MSTPLLYSFEPDTGIACLTFNRPDVLNAINVPMAQALLAAARKLAATPGLRCVVLTGAGRAFMAGGDVSGFGRDAQQASLQINALLDALHPFILTLRGLDAPIVAVVRGVAAGAGLSLALLADLVLAEENAKFLMAYDRLGGVPDCGCSWLLPRKTGSGRASELMLLSRTLSASLARDWGMVNAVIPADEYAAALDDVAKTLARGATRAFGAFRRLVDLGGGQGLAAHLELERDAFLALSQTRDFSEGVTAFLEKRAPQFCGC